MRVRAHNGAALQVAAGALAARTRELPRVQPGRRRVRRDAALLAVWGGGVRGADAGGARAGLLRVAGAGAGAADGAGGGELAAVAAVLVGVVADGAGLEAAGARVAAGVRGAVGLAAAVAVLAVLDDAVAALVAGDGGDAAVGGEAGRVDAVAADAAADVADAAGGEVRDALGGGGVHDVLFAGVAGLRVERAALLRGDHVGLGAGLVGAVVHGAEGVAGLMAGVEIGGKIVA